MLYEDTDIDPEQVFIALLRVRVRVTLTLTLTLALALTQTLTLTTCQVPPPGGMQTGRGGMKVITGSGAGGVLA